MAEGLLTPHKIPNTVIPGIKGTIQQHSFDKQKLDASIKSPIHKNKRVGYKESPSKVSSMMSSPVRKTNMNMVRHTS